MKTQLALCVLFGAAISASAQIVPFIEVQGEGDTSPYVDQQITVSGKVTETFGDSWYVQDDYGAWNGLYIVGPDVVIPANVPYWNADRQPEVGDVLELTGTVIEEDGNTQLVDVTLVEFVDFWNATPAGIWTTAAETQDERYEGTRIRLENATVLTAPDADGYWTVAMDDGEVTCWGIDTYDPSNNEDPDGPTPGDVYLIYGASHQAGDEYVLHVGDIDVVTLGTADLEAIEDAWVVYPNPAVDVIRLINSAHAGTESGWAEVVDLQGRTVFSQPGAATQPIDVSALPVGMYTLRWSAFDKATVVERVFLKAQAH